MGQPRGILPDDVDDTQVFLFKAASYLRLTYEIRLAAYMAQQRGLALVLSVPPHVRFSPELSDFIAQERVSVRRGATT